MRIKFPFKKQVIISTIVILVVFLLGFLPFLFFIPNLGFLSFAYGILGGLILLLGISPFTLIWLLAFLRWRKQEVFLTGEFIDIEENLFSSNALLFSGDKKEKNLKTLPLFTSKRRDLLKNENYLNKRVLVGLDKHQRIVAFEIEND